jgi:hypothetical protein
MPARTIFLFAALLVAVPALRAADDPLIGTWKLNVAKSKFSPGPGYKSQTLKYEPASNGGLKLTADIVDAQGKQLHDGYTAVYDGKEYPMAAPSSNADTVKLERIDAYTTVRTNKKDGKPTMIQKRTVSKDGKTMTVTTTGTNGQGQQLNNVQVYDRQ